jgi:dienelactone hydrolase
LRLRPAIAAVVAALVVGGCASAHPRVVRASAGGIFDYPPGPLDVRENGVQRFDGYAVHDLSYASPVRGRVTAYLVLPAGPGPFPAILWQPGLNGGRDDQLADAVALAAKGAASLLIDPPHVRTGGPSLITCTTADRRTFAQYVVEVRRGIDLLSSRPEIDGRRLGDVGFSLGSTIAGVLSGVDRRLRAVVVESGRAYHTGYLRGACAGTSRRRLRAYLRGMGFTNPIRYVAHAAPTALLLQNGTRDPFTPRREALALQRAASQPKTVRWYPGGHELTPEAFADRDRFLERELGLGGEDAQAASARLELSYTAKAPSERWPHLWLSAADGSRARKLESRAGDKQ